MDIKTELKQGIKYGSAIVVPWITANSWHEIFHILGIQFAAAANGKNLLSCYSAARVIRDELGRQYEIHAPACNFDQAILHIIERPEWKSIIAAAGPVGVGIMGATLLQIGIPLAFDERRNGLARFNGIGASLLGFGMMLDAGINIAAQPLAHTGDFQVVVNSLAQMGLPEPLAMAVPIAALGLIGGTLLSSYRRARHQRTLNN